MRGYDDAMFGGVEGQYPEETGWPDWVTAEKTTYESDEISIAESPYSEFEQGRQQGYEEGYRAGREELAMAVLRVMLSDK